MMNATFQVKPQWRAWVSALFLSVSLPSYAGLGSSLNSFYDGLGYNTNVNNPNAFKGQSANYYNGGSLYLRTKIQNAQLVSTTLPSISAGCGGIDMFMGAFSHINSDQLVQFGKSVVSNAVPFATDLALQTWAPQIKQIRDNLQNIADKYLNQSINSCETAQAAVGALAAYGSSQARGHVCATMGTQNNAFADWVSAKNECGVGGQAATQLNNAKNDPALKSLTKTNDNIVWNAIIKNNFLSSDKDLAQFLMSLSGTFIYDANGNPTYYPSLLSDNNNMINALLVGGEVESYRCDSQDTCLTLSTGSITLAASEGLQTKTRDVITELYTALSGDAALTDYQKSFLEYTKIPIFAFLTDYVRSGEVPPFDLYAQVIAVDLVDKYLSNMLSVVKTSLINTATDPSNVNVIKSDIDKARSFTRGLSSKALSDLTNYETLIAQKKQQQHILNQALSDKTRQQIQFGG